MRAHGQEVYLGSYLAPLAPFLARQDITDIYVNRPGEVWIEGLGGIVEQHELPGLTTAVLARLARQIAASSAQGINREHPLLAAALPDGSRVQVALPPATRGDIALAIRKHIVAGMTLSDYDEAGFFDAINTGLVPASKLAPKEPANPACSDVSQRLREAIRQRRNILISGGTSTGKTTFLNALLQEIPPRERIILIEDTPELQLVHANGVGLLAARSSLGEAAVTAEDLLIASLRMRPDRIILGEIRGKEAMTFLRAVNTGHPGSLCTIHADSPERAIDQLALLVLQTGARMSWEDVVRYVRNSLDVIVQLERRDGRRKVSSLVTPSDN